MKKIWIKRAIIGSILIAIIAAGIGFAGYKWAKQYYYDELENAIIEQYLEGRNAICAISSDPHIFAPLNPTKCFRLILDNGDMCILGASADTIGYIYNFQRIWKDIDYQISNDDIINKLDSKEFSWFILHYRNDNSLNCAIMKKTNRGFDIIDEKIVGVGFNYLPPSATTENGKHKRMKWIDEKDFVLYKQYMNYLLNDIYNGIYFREENIVQKDKYNLITYLRYPLEGRYKGNKYYELKPDPYYRYIGANELESMTRRYGNYFHTLYGRSITAHYSIQEKGTVLEDTFLKKTSIAGVGLILAYIIFCAIMNNKKVKS